MQNSLYPGFVKLNYGNGFGRSHVAVLPVLPNGTYSPGDTPSFLTRTASVISFADMMDAYIAAIDGAFSSGTQFGVASYWQLASPTSDPVWIADYNTDAPGTNVGTDAALLQSVYTFRTDQGGILKLYLMEGVGTPNTKDVPPITSFRLDITTFMVGNGHAIVGRDGGFPVTPIAVTMKTNDALRKKFFLDA